MKERHTMEEVKKEYLDLISVLKKWCKENENKIKKAYFTKDYLILDDRSLLFLIQTNSSKYDDSFEESLTNLDLKIANDHKYKNMKMDVQSWPDIEEDIWDYYMKDELNIIFE